jgi:hypothetical protein
MGTYSFVVHVSGVNLNGEYEDLFWPACDDATILVRDDAMLLDFDREADSYESAVKSALADVRRSGAHVDSVERQVSA